jgi:hypothetical protein
MKPAKTVTLQSEHKLNEHLERLPTEHTVMEGTKVVVTTTDFAYALQCYLNRVQNL